MVNIYSRNIYIQIYIFTYLYHIHIYSTNQCMIWFQKQWAKPTNNLLHSSRILGDTHSRGNAMLIITSVSFLLAKQQQIIINSALKNKGDSCEQILITFQQILIIFTHWRSGIKITAWAHALFFAPPKTHEWPKRYTRLYVCAYIRCTYTIHNNGEK